MSTIRCRSALAFISTSLLLGSLPALAAAKAKTPPPPPTLLEAEYEAAKKTDLYLVLRPASKSLEVRARGATLETVKLDAVSLMRYQPPSGGEAVSTSPPPLYWTINEDPDQSHRKVIAPSELKPYPQEEEEEQNAEVTVPPVNVAPAPEPPATYRILLDHGWKLLVTQQPPPTDLKGRLLYAFHEGWSRLQGQQPDTTDLVVLLTSEAEAQRIYHLFRLGTLLLLDTGKS